MFFHTLVYQKKWHTKVAVMLLSYSLAYPCIAQIPVINGFSPISGPVGAIVTITGSNFGANNTQNTVHFGSVQAIVTAASPTSLTVTVPPSASYGPLTVTTNGLTAYSSRNFSIFGGKGALTDNSFTGRNHFKNNASADNLLMQDLDGDGKPDAISSDDSLRIFRNISTPGNVQLQTPKIFSQMRPFFSRVGTGDLDGDGKIDLVLTKRQFTSNPSLVICKNNSTLGNIDFNITTLYSSAGTELYSPSISDFDLDGKPDIIAFYNSNDYEIAFVFRNTTVNGNMSFASPTLISLPNNGAYNAQVADVDGDGKPDFIYQSDPSLGRVLVGRNTSSPGNISFSVTTPISAGRAITEIDIADMDNDGKLDIVTYYELRFFGIYRNASSAGSVSFPTKTDFTNPEYIRNLNTCDLDGDGLPEICFVNFSNNFSIFKNSSTVGNFVLAPSVKNWCEYNMTRMEISDVDGDGGNDIVLANKLITVVRNVTGSPGINSYSPITGGPGTIVTIKGNSFTGTTAVSFNGINVSSFSVLSDSVITATSANNPAGEVSVTNILGTGILTGQYPPPKITSVNPLVGPAGTIVTIRGNNFGPIATDNTVHFGAVRGTVTAATDTTIMVVVPRGATYTPLTVTTNKLTAKAAKPFILTFAGGDTALNARSFDARQDFINNIQAEDFVSGDFDYDGRTDFIMRGSPITIFTNKSDSATVLLAGKSGINEDSRANVDGDADGDGRIDKILAGAGAVTVGRNISNAAGILFDRTINQSLYLLLPSFQYYFDKPFLTDLDMDGKPDVITGLNDLNAGTANISVLKNTTSDYLIKYELANYYPARNYLGRIKATDLDGDGLEDVIGVQASNYNGFVTYRNLSTAAGIALAPHQYFSSAVSSRDIGIGDIDGDGKTDVLIVNGGFNNFSAHRNISTPGNISFAAPVNFIASYSPVWLAVGDLNGDGKPDVVMGCTSDSSISIFRNTSVPGTFSFAPRLVYKTPHLPKEIQIVDVDMDGLPDIAVASLNDFWNGPPVLSIFRNRQGQPFTQLLCPPLGNTTLISPITGSSYQWQMSTDSINYMAITDGVNFNGAATANLQLINIPSAWYGRMFRCVVDGQNSLPTIIKFVNRWTGTVNTDWHNPGNWSCGTVPDAFTDVIIPTGSSILGNNTAVRTLTIYKEASLIINSGVTLTVMH